MKTKGTKTQQQNGPKATMTLWQRLKQIGPALVLAAAVLGPGSITLSTLAGSLYGYQLLWVPVLTTTFMITYTWMSARIGLVTGKTLFQVTRDKYGAALARVGGVLAFLAVMAFQAGNTAGIGFAGDALLGGGPRLWAALFVGAALSLVLLPNLYDKLELLVKGVVGVMIVTFVGTVLVVGIDVEAAAAGLVPRFPSTEALFTALGIAATTFSIVAAFYQSYLVKEKDWGPEQLATQGFEALLGIGLLGTIAIVVILTSAGALEDAPGGAFTAETMAQQLEPLAGPAAFYLFTIGLFFASLSSLTVNPLIGGTLLADSFDYDPSMDGRPVKGCTAVAMAGGLVPILLFGGDPVELLRAAQAAAVVAFPLLGYVVLSLAGDRDVMGEHVNTTGVHVFAWLGYLMIIGIVLNYIRQIAGVF